MTLTTTKAKAQTYPYCDPLCTQCPKYYFENLTGCAIRAKVGSQQLPCTSYAIPDDLFHPYVGNQAITACTCGDCGCVCIDKITVYDQNVNGYDINFQGLIGSNFQSPPQPTQVILPSNADCNCPPGMTVAIETAYTPAVINGVTYYQFSGFRAYCK